MNFKNILFTLIVIALVNCQASDGKVAQNEAKAIIKMANIDTNIIKHTHKVNDNISSPLADIDINYLTGKFEYTKHKSFVVIDQKYCKDGKGAMYLRKEAYESFKKMLSVLNLLLLKKV